MCKKMFKYILIYVKKNDLVECVRYREDTRFKGKEEVIED